MPARPRPSRTSEARRLVLLAATFGGLAVGACGSTTSLQVKKVAAVAEAPSNVAMQLKVTAEEGQPVTLLATDFSVYEDGKQIPSKKLKRALLPIGYVIDRYVMVVVDLSGSLVDSEYLSTLQDTVATFTDRMAKGGHVALSVFDGDGLKPFVNFKDNELRPGLSAMRKFRPHNRNIDLYGTFMAALDVLDEAGNASAAPQKTTTLVFMTDRRDKAGKHTLDEANTRMLASPADVYVLGIGDAINREELLRLGKPDTFFAEKQRDLGKPFDDTAAKIEGQRSEDYLFAYCSLAKPGKKPAKHKVEVRIANKLFKGSVDHEFSARNFTKDACDPRRKPDFAAVVPDDAGPEPAGDDAADEDSEKKSTKGKKSKSGSKKKSKPADDEEAESEAN
jgi:hypothetical protein